ncbi:MAG: ATP-binding cassette domain-containing protein [Desulfarculaceae bacterium]|jgi:ABC-2 type transport system ATP-binding protein
MVEQTRAQAPGTDPAAVVRVEGLSKSFFSGGRRITALNAIDAQVEAGIISGLIGPDAAGKTTFMRILCGLLRPDQGSAQVLGFDTMRRPVEVQSRVGYMPQRFGLYEDLSVQQNLDLYADLKGLPSSRRKERFAQLMRMTGLEPYTSRLAKDLSGGMKQKLGLACTLLGQSELLILDEPTVGVDPLSRRELWSIIHRLVEEEGLSVLLSTAYLDEAERCQSVILMHAGKVLGQGAPEDFTSEMQGRTFLALSAGSRRRRLQRCLSEQPGVLDAVLTGSGVRVVSVLEKAPELSELAGEWQNVTLEPTPPRFEDSFIARMRPSGGRSEVSPGGDMTARTLDESDHALIQVKDLVRRFGKFEAVQGISFSVNAGEVFGLLGPNGAGKTTTFRMLCGLLPISSGSLTVAGMDLRKAASQARSRIGYMAQRFSLYAHLSVDENLRFFSSAYGLQGGRQKERIQWALEELGLGQVEETPSGELSLGYKQRLALAVALMHEPEILFLDEPTSGVDPVARREFWQRINLLAEGGVTVLITTHFMEEAEYCDRLIIMERGRILAEGAPDEIKRRFAGESGLPPSLEQAFITLVERHREGQL